MTIPPDLRELFKRHNGLSFIDGTSIDPLNTQADAKMWMPRLPDAPRQFMAFGNDGGDGGLGIWCSQSALRGGPCAVIDVLDWSWMPGCVTPVSLDLAAFLTTHTAYSLMLASDCWATGGSRADAVSPEDWREALNVLDIPDWIRAFGHNVGDKEFAAIREWAEPAETLFLQPREPADGWTDEDLLRILGE
ncbi:MAG: hypothetical protein QM783_10785 [Phycisphaerales bacterium]